MSTMMAVACLDAFPHVGPITPNVCFYACWDDKPNVRTILDDNTRFATQEAAAKAVAILTGKVLSGVHVQVGLA
jgi:hypothetical protein